MWSESIYPTVHYLEVVPPDVNFFCDISQKQPASDQSDQDDAKTKS